MDDPQAWILVWLAVAGIFLVGEILIAGTFYLLPFGISAFFAMLVAIPGAPIPLQWAVFLVGGGIAFWYLMKWGQRTTAEHPLPPGVGADRLVGEVGPITSAVPGGPTETGRVKLGAEDWAAESADESPIADGTVVKVLEVRGTRVIVTPTENGAS